MMMPSLGPALSVHLVPRLEARVSRTASRVRPTLSRIEPLHGSEVVSSEIRLYPKGYKLLDRLRCEGGIRLPASHS